MLSENIIQLNKICLKRTIGIETAEAIKRSPSGRFLCSAGLFQSVVPPSVPQTTCHQKKSSFKKKQLFFCCLRSQSPHGRFLRSSGLLRPQHKPARKMRVSVRVHRPLFFQRLLIRTAIGVAPLRSAVDSRNAYADLYFFPAVTRSHPYSPEKGLPGLWWLFEAATPRGAPRYCSVKNSTIPAVLRGVSCTA